MIRMAVRALVALSLGMLAAVPAADAQQPSRILRVGVLYPGGSGPLSPRMEAFRRGLREHGYAEGTNVAIDIRYAEGRTERLPELAAELVRLKANVISPSGDLATRVVQQATATIPIVALTDDLVGAGLVASHAHPGGNTTGVSIFSPELNVKRLELLKAALPRVSRVATLWDPATGRSQLTAVEAAAQALAVRL